jgi:hypothetical protein
VDSMPRARARARGPYPYPSRPYPGGARAYRPSLYNQLVQRAARAISHFVNKTQASTIARIIHTLLETEHFDSIADLADAVKWKLAQLRIRWTNDDLDRAYRLVATARPLPGAPR